MMRVPTGQDEFGVQAGPFGFVYDLTASTTQSLLMANVLVPGMGFGAFSGAAYLAKMAPGIGPRISGLIETPIGAPLLGGHFNLGANPSILKEARRTLRAAGINTNDV